MSIHQALAFGISKIGHWGYCTDPARRFGQTNTCADCSGFVSRCLWEGGMPRYAFPEDSANMARWFEARPGQRLSIPRARATLGAVVVYGGIYGYGPRGHVEFSLGDGRTLGSAGSTSGVGIHAFDRLRWSHGGYAPISYATAPPPPPPDPEILDVEHGLAVDVTLNPTKPTQGYELDRWGGIHPFGGAKAPTGKLPYWAGFDVARRLVITSWSAPAGYVLDLKGAMHPFGGAPPLAGTPYWDSGKIIPMTET